jgi:hypothetical protein
MPCQSVSDCTVEGFTTLNCFLSCGFLVGTADVASVTAATATLCDPYFAAGCPKMFPLLCPGGAVPQRLCDHGRCGYTPPGVDSGALDASGPADARFP